VAASRHPHESRKRQKPRAYTRIQPAICDQALDDLDLLRRLVPRWHEFAKAEVDMGAVAAALVTVIHRSRLDPGIAMRLRAAPDVTMGCEPEGVPEVESLNIAG
jgi:hypothetical protein